MLNSTFMFLEDLSLQEGARDNLNHGGETGVPDSPTSGWFHQFPFKKDYLEEGTYYLVEKRNT